MFFTRRFAERHALGWAMPRTATALLLLGAAASCSEDPDALTPSDPDAASPTPEASTPVPDASADSPPDAARLEVKCTVTPCVRELSASWSESFCARLDDGRVVCWGRNAGGEVGGDAGPWTATPTPVEGVTGAVALDRTCAIAQGGGITCWGPATAPTGDTSSLRTARSIRIGDGLGCAVLADGKVSCWGKDGPDGVLTYAGSDAGGGADVPPTIVPLEGAVDEIAIAHSLSAPPACPWCPPLSAHAVIARRTDGTVTSWGLSPLIGRATEQKPDPKPGRIAAEGVDHVFGGFGGCVLAGGAAGCWGFGRDDLGGDLRPLPIAVIKSVTHVTLGDYGDGRFGRGCAATSSGDVYCWGENDYGQAGDGTHSFRDLPTKVLNLPEPIARVEVTAGTTCALAVSGRVYCWGDDGFGQRGLKTPFTKNPAPLPVELP